MKARLTWLLIAGLAAATAAGQSAAGVGEAAPGVSVISFDWKYAGYGRAETVREKESVETDDASTAYRLARRTVYIFKYEARVTLKNGGAKAIKAVSWEHVFTDAEGGKELRRYRLQSKQQVPPGEARTLSAGVGIDPKESTRHITTGKQSVEVTRIEYADGSVWKRQ